MTMEICQRRSWRRRVRRNSRKKISRKRVQKMMQQRRYDWSGWKGRTVSNVLSCSKGLISFKQNWFNRNRILMPKMKQSRSLSKNWRLLRVGVCQSLPHVSVLHPWHVWIPWPNYIAPPLTVSSNRFWLVYTCRCPTGTDIRKPQNKYTPFRFGEISSLHWQNDSCSVIRSFVSHRNTVTISN